MLEHDHSFTETVVEPTCAANGYKQYVCSCGETYIEYLDRVEHCYIKTVVPANCTSEGYTRFDCACGSSYKDFFVSPPKHNYLVNAQVDATCAGDGCVEYICPCGDSYVIVTPATEHNYVVFVVEPTCTEQGYSRYTCSCGAFYEDCFVPPSEHSYSISSRINATCVSNGYERYVCDCGDIYTVTLPMLDHKYSTAVFTPTCTERGYSEHICECGEKYIDSYTDKTPHSWKAWRTVKEATISAQGSKTRECSVCSKSETVAIAPKKSLELSQITPVDIFAKLTPNARKAVDAMLQYIAEHYDCENPCDVSLGNFKLNGQEIREIKFLLSVYFGFFSVDKIVEFYPVDYINGSLVYEVVVINERQHSPSLIMLERNRREMMTTIDDVLYSFEHGSEDELIEQVFFYLINKLSYEKDRADAATAIQTGRGNCNSYGHLFMLMLARLGIDSDACVGLSSKGGYHLWNRVILPDGEYQYYDLTYYESTKSAKYFGAPSLQHELVAVNRYLTRMELN